MEPTTWLLIGLLALPLWLPLLFLLAYLLVVLCSLCVDGLVYFAQNSLGVKWSPGRHVRILLIPVALPLFPLAMTAELVLLFTSRAFRGGISTFSWLVQTLRNLPVWASLPLVLGWVGAPVLRIFLAGSLEADDGGVLPTWLWMTTLWVLALPMGISILQVGRSIWRHRGQFLGVGGPQTGIFESFVGLRYLKAKKDQSFISAITLISVVGVMVGVCALTVVLSVMGGFEEDLKQKILGTNSHVIVLRFGGDIADWPALHQQVTAVEGVVAATPFIYSEAMLTTDSSVAGVVLKGFDPGTIGGVTDLIQSIRQGPSGEPTSLEEKQQIAGAVIPAAEGSLPGILLGEELANSLHVIVGDEVSVVSPLGEIGPMGTRIPRFKKFLVTGVFHSGMYEYDSKFSYISLKAAQEFLSMKEEVTGLELKVKDIYEAREVGRRIESQVGYPYWTRDWMEMNKNLFAALRLEKIVMGIILTMIVGVAALNIISTLIMLVIEKGKEIAILKAMGASNLQIMKVFMIEGVVIGFTGTTLGSALGLGLCLMLSRFDFIRLNPDVYYLDSLPVQISGGMFVVVGVVSMAISFLATIYPSWRAAVTDPVEGLRYE